MKKHALAAVLVAGLAVPAVAAGAADVLKARMTGAQIVNDAGGAPQGVAQATISLNDSRRRVCFEIEYSGLGGRATGGFLRRGGPGELARPSVVLFTGSSESPVSGCVSRVPSKTLTALSERPTGHYVDLTTRRHPKGAVRGQLRPGDDAGELEGPSSGGVGRP